MAERKSGFISDTTMIQHLWKFKITKFYRFHLKDFLLVNLVSYLGTGRFSTNSSLHTTLNQFGWTVTGPGVGMTRSRELGLAVWERCVNLNIETDH